MKLIIILFLLLNLPSAYATYFHGTFWEQTVDCETFSPNCLPQQAEKPTVFEFEVPHNNDEPLEMEITGKKYIVKIFFKLKKNEYPYYIFQTTLRTLEGQTFAICSRYESIDTMESLPVGSCGGLVSAENRLMAGFTISKKQ